MRLLNAHITDYRSVDDSGKFDIDPQVTCLVGKNEAGKTAILQALYQLNPVERTGGFNETLDFPSKAGRRRRKQQPEQMIPAVEAEFELTDDEVAEVTDALGEGALTPPKFILTKGYRSSGGGIWDFAFDETAIVRHFLAQLDPTTKEGIGTPDSVSELVDRLTAHDERPNAATELLNQLTDWGGEGWRLVQALVKPMLPRFVYFEDYDTMPGKVSITDLAKKRAEDRLTRGEQALINLLDLGGADPEDFDTRNHEVLVREIESAGASITAEVFEYWTQNPGLSVKLQTFAPEENADPELAEGTNLQVRVFNPRHNASVQFNERSRGFVWFFSFLAYFTSLEDAEDDTDLILLLDEPGLSLHGRAQEDLLRLLERASLPFADLGASPRRSRPSFGAVVYRIGGDAGEMGNKLACGPFRGGWHLAVELLWDSAVTSAHILTRASP